MRSPSPPNAPMNAPSNVPLTVIGGFLGAGKTTLLNHLLGEAARSANKVRYGVLVNDFGDLAIDEDLIVAHDGTTIALANGCICCTIGDDLVETIMDLMESAQPPEHLIIEASGVADPAPIAELGSLDPHLSRDLTLVVIDAVQVRNQWADERLRETVGRQIASANLLVLNKTETMDDKALGELKAWIGERAPEVPLVISHEGKIPFSVFEGEPLNRAPSTTAKSPTRNHVHDLDHAGIFETRTLDVNPKLSVEAFRRLFQSLPPSVLRAKGHVMLEGTSHLAQKVGPQASLKSADQDVAHENANRMVVIGVAPLVEMTWFAGMLASSQD